MNKNDRILKIIDLLYTECISSGGDGDALWFSTYESISDILNVVESYNKQLKHPMEIQVSVDTINWGEHQEWITITVNEDLYKNVPSWGMFVLKA